MSPRFCPSCGGPLTNFAEQGAPRQRCLWCGRVHYRNPKAAVGAIVHRDGRILLSERAREPLAGHWDLPGGFLEVGEHPVAALKRELAEETGLTVDVGRLVHVDVGTYGEDATLNLVYACRANGEPVARDDSRDLRWFRAERLPGMAFPHEAEAVRKWRSDGASP